MTGAEVESLPGAFKADMINLLRSILNGLFWLFRLPYRLKRLPGLVLPEADSARQVYHHFLRWTGAGGYPRQVFQTPYEYLTSMVKLLPEAQEDLAIITEQYVAARYSSSLPGGDELNRMKQSWHRVRRNRLRKPHGEPAV